MAPFQKLNVLASDGVAEYKDKKTGKMIPNAPEAKMLDSTPTAANGVDYYKPLDEMNEKAIDWKRKLAYLLAIQAGRSEEEAKKFILDRFPENYRLYEHNRYVIGVKGHNDRHDAYLYGHPKGVKKRFRSPADFANHLVWLAMDQEQDSDNCTCLCCQPAKEPSEKKGKKAEKKTEKKAVNAPAPATTPVLPRREDSVDKVMVDAGAGAGKLEGVAEEEPYWPQNTTHFSDPTRPGQRVQAQNPGDFEKFMDLTD